VCCLLQAAHSRALRGMAFDTQVCLHHCAVVKMKKMKMKILLSYAYVLLGLPLAGDLFGADAVVYLMSGSAACCSAVRHRAYGMQWWR
jgi:hypothetical protein